MLSLLLSLLIALAQALSCAGPTCLSAGSGEAGPGSRHAHQHAQPPPLDDALAMLGRAAIEGAFSGVVRIGDRAGAGSSSTASEC